MCFVEDDAVEVEVEQRAKVFGPQCLALHWRQIIVLLKVSDRRIGGELHRNFFVARHPVYISELGSIHTHTLKMSLLLTRWGNDRGRLG